MRRRTPSISVFPSEFTIRDLAGIMIERVGPTIDYFALIMKERG